MTADLHRFNVGQFKCCAISDSSREAEITSIFTSVPEDKLLSAISDVGYPDKKFTSGYNVLFVDTGDKKVLIDAGLGTGTLIENMNSAGIPPEEIDLIAITHGDGDHIGGILNEAGELNFPNARYALWNEAYEKWTNESERADMVDEIIRLFRGREDVSEESLAQAAERRALYGTTTLPKIKEMLDLYELNVEILPGMKFIPAAGHRSDHVAVSINSRGETLLHVADSIKHPVQALHQDWHGHIDTYPEMIADTNKKLFSLIAEQNATFFCTHLAFPGLARLDENGRMIIIEAE